MRITIAVVNLFSAASRFIVFANTWSKVSLQADARGANVPSLIADKYFQRLGAKYRL